MASPPRPKWSVLDANVEAIIAVVLDTQMPTDALAQYVGVLLVWLVVLGDGGPKEVQQRTEVARADVLGQWSKRIGLERAIDEEKRATRQLVSSMARALRGRRDKRERAPDYAADAARARALVGEAPAMAKALASVDLTEMLSFYVSLRGEIDDTLEQLPPSSDVRDAGKRELVEAIRLGFGDVTRVMDAVFVSRARADHLRAAMTEQFRVPEAAADRLALLEPGSGAAPEGHSMLDERFLDTLAWVRVLGTIDERRMSRTVGRSIGLALMTRHALFAQRMPSTPDARALLRTAVTRVDAMIERLAIVWGRVRAADGETDVDAVPDVGAVLTRALRALREDDDELAMIGAGRALSDLAAAMQRVPRPTGADASEDRAHARFHAAAPDAVHAILDRWTERLVEAGDVTAPDGNAFAALGLRDALTKLRPQQGGKKRR